MGFPRQEYWSGLPFPSPGDLPDPGIEPCLVSGSSFTGRQILNHLATWESRVLSCKAEDAVKYALTSLRASAAGGSYSSQGSGGVSCEAGVSGDAVILPGHVFGGGV